MQELQQYLRDLKGGVCVAFSGGVDSAVILKLAAQQCDRVCAVTFETDLTTDADAAFAKETAQQWGIEHVILRPDTLQLEQVRYNRRDRCYVCKRFMFEQMRRYAEDNGYAHLIDGTNADDLKTDRPGLRALRELSVRSPLGELNIPKTQVRQIARDLGISAADRPSSPCLATRFEYDTLLTPKKLQQAEQGEDFLRKIIPGQFRLRIHGKLARIEVPQEQFMRVLDFSQQITEQLKILGFMYVTLDLQGFRSGSMDT